MDQSASSEEVLVWAMGGVYVCGALKTAMAATDVVSVDAAVASVQSELERVSSLKEEQRKTVCALVCSQKKQQLWVSWWIISSMNAEC